MNSSQLASLNDIKPTRTNMTKNRMVLSHPTVLSQAVNKTYNAAKDKLLSGVPLHKVQELHILWEHVCHPCDVISSACSCEAILNLIKSTSGNFKLTDVLNTIIDQSPSSTHMQWIVHLAFKTMNFHFVLAAKSCEQCGKLKFESPYKLRTHPHPLISIVEAAPKSWPFILTEIQTLFLEWGSSPLNDEHTISNVFELLKPFFVYILCNPSDDDKVVLRRTTLFSTINNLCETDNKLHIFECDHIITVCHFLEDIFSSMMPTEINLQLYSQCLLKIQSFQSSSFKDGGDFIKRHCLRTLTLTYEFLNNPASAMLSHFLYQIIKMNSSLLECPCTLAIGLSGLLCKAPPESISLLLHATMALLESSQWQSHASPSAILSIYVIKASVLQLLLNKDFIGFFHLQSTIRLTLAKIDKIIMDVIPSNSSCSCTSFIAQGKHTNAWLTNTVIVLKQFQNFNHNFINKVKEVLNINLLGDVTLTLCLMVCGIVLSGSSSFWTVDHALYKECLEFLGFLASRFAEVSLVILPVILHLIKNETNEFKLCQLLSVLPNLASHQDCISIVLGTIQAMCAVPNLQPTAMHLLLQLFKRQERCFPYLQKMIMQLKAQFNPTLSNELSTIKAISVKEVCKTSPYKNTNEMIKIISNMLQAKVHSGQAAFLIEGLSYLLENEAVDIRTTWLALQDTIMKYTSPSVVKSSLRMLSLTSKLETENSIFTSFRDEVIDFIWKHVQSENADVVSTALVSLAHFKVENFSVRHLPVQVRPKEPLPDKNSTLEETKEAFLQQLIPGDCFVRLVTNASLQTEYFFQSLLKQEMNNMPRDIKHRALQSLKKSSHSSAMSDIPRFMLKMYERNKLPNLKSSFAAGLLMCYNPLGNDDVAQNVLVSKGRNTFQILQALLSEVTIDSKSWQSVLWISLGWKAFMQKCLTAMVKGRRAELEMQLQQPNCDKEDVQHKLLTSNLWCRDKITEQIKTTSKGTPSMQGNAALALGGLMCAALYHKSESDENEEVCVENTGYSSLNHWIRMATDTIICIVDSNHKPAGRIFSWCQYRAVSHTGRLTTSELGKICGMHSLTMVTSVLLSVDTARISVILDMLLRDVAVDAKCSAVNTTTRLHCCISLGGVVSQLCNENFQEVCELSVTKKLNSCIATLTENIFVKNNEADNIDDFEEFEDNEDVGSVVALGILLSSMVCNGRNTSKENAQSILEKLKGYMDNLDEKSVGYKQAVCSAVAWVHVASVSVKAISVDKAAILLQSMNKLLNNKSNIALSQCIACLCCAISLTGETESVKLFDTLHQQWLTQVSNDRLPTRQKLTSLNGLAALVGSESIFASCLPENIMKINNKVNKVVQILQNFARNGKDSGISSNSILLLAHLYLSFQVSPNRTVSIPSSFSYLPESSILRPMFDILLQYSEKSHEELFRNKVNCILSALSKVTSEPNVTLPPVNWSIVFSPMFDDPDLEVGQQKACFQIILSQCKENKIAASLLSKWIQIKLFKTLHLTTQHLFYNSLDVLVKNLSSTSIISFLDYASTVLVTNESVESDHFVLKGILSCLTMNDIPQEIPGLLFNIIKRLLREYPFSLSDELLTKNWKIITDCAGACPDCDSLLIVNHKVTIALKAMFVKCNLISKGDMSLQWCNDCVDLIASVGDMDTKSACLWILYQCCQHILSSNSIPTLKRVQWLQELMGHINKSFYANTDMEFLMKLFSVAVISWSEASVPLKGNYEHVPYFMNREFGRMHLYNQCIKILPHALCHLLSKKVWKENLTATAIEWLVSLKRHEHLSEKQQSITLIALETLIELRHCQGFQKSSSWTNAIAAILL